MDADKGVLVLARINWGSVPDWLAGLGLFLLAYTLFRDHRLQRRRDEQEERRLAERVLCWAERSSEGPFDLDVVIQNNSGRELTNLVITVRPTRVLEEAPFTEGNSTFSVKMLPPDEDIYRVRRPIFHKYSTYSVVEMTFTDADGRRWVRSTQEPYLTRYRLPIEHDPAWKLRLLSARDRLLRLVRRKRDPAHDALPPPTDEA